MKRSAKNYVIVFASLVAILTVGYGTFAQPLAQDTKLCNDTWEIGFTDAYKSGSTGNVMEISGVHYTSNKAFFYVKLSDPGDTITYTFTIKNKGKLNAKVSSIDIVPPNKYDDSIYFTTNGLNIGDVIKPKETAQIKVTAKYNKNYKGTHATYKDAYIIINYIQAS